MKMLVKDLREALKDVSEDAEVTFQGNVPSGEEDESEEPGHTTCYGYVYSAFDRNGKGKEFVIDCAIVNQE